MFGALISWLTGAWTAGWSALTEGVKEGWREGKAVISTKWGALIIYTGLVFTLVSNVEKYLIQLVDMFDHFEFPDLDTSITDSGVLGALTLANTFFPVTYAFKLVIVLVTFCGVLMVIRFIKWVKSIFWAG